MNQKNFQRNIEDFVCEKCGQKNIGNGYTNHCSKCLYSKHVDVNPGDREADCGGLMIPKEVFQKNRESYIKHVCEKCSYIKNNKISKIDSFDEIVKISVAD